MKIVERILPPFIFDLVYQSQLRSHGWFGDYRTWEEAARDSEGYDAAIIIEKVKTATLQVKKGVAAYERDSVLFNKIEYDWPTLAGLLWVAARDQGKLNVVDFGGSLGSTYWQNRKFLNSISSVRWNIIEQSGFVECGKQFIEDEVIRFYEDFPSCLHENKPNVVLLSSVLSYIEEPFELLQFIKQLNIQFIIIDRLLTIKASNDRLTVQKVPSYIYKASYPAWFFSYSKFKDFIEQHFRIIEEYNCSIRTNIPSQIKGFILAVK